MTEVKNLSFSYRCGRQILRRISFSVPTGSCLAILGNNGAGKSTLLKCLSHLLRPQEGEVLVDGADLLSQSVAQAARTVALVSQTPQPSRLTVYDMVLLGRKPYLKWDFTDHDRALAEGALRQLGLEDMALRYADQLSGGEGQKVQLARALTQEPRLLLLDEPTSSLDLKHQLGTMALVRDLCRREGLTAVAAIHDLNLAAMFCTRFLLLREGGVFAQGGAEEVLTRENIRAVYGVDTQPLTLRGRPYLLPIPPD